MYVQPTEEELDFFGAIHDSATFLENVFPSDINAPGNWSVDSKCLILRPYQFAMIAYDYMYCPDDSKSEKQNFSLSKGAGTIYNISARNIGKTHCGLLGDAMMSIFLQNSQESCAASFDEKHLKAIAEKISGVVENHKLFQMLHLDGNKKTVGRDPHRVQTAHGHLQVGVNEKVSGNKQGQDFHGLHYKRLSYDEASYMSTEGFEKRIDSGSSTGYVERLFGIPDLRVGSPLGEILNNPKNKKFICRLPQYVREDWDDLQKEKQVDQYGGESSVAYKLNVAGELIEGASSKWDMERIKKNCYKFDKKIQFFEVDKEIFKGLDLLGNLERKEELNKRLKSKLPIERLPSSKIIMASDIGTSGSPSEITIFFGNNDNHWKYEYQISLFKMIVKEQIEVFKWIYDTLGSCFIALDCTNIDGGTIRQGLLDLEIPTENLSNFKMNQNLEVGVDKDEKTGRVLRDKSGRPLMKIENTKAFAIKCLEDIFYNAKVEIPHDEKFLKEFSGFIERYNGNRPSWGSTTTEHLHDSFLQFALCSWENEMKVSQNKGQKKRVLGSI